MQTLAVFCTLSRMVEDSARTETPFLRVFDARYGDLLKYNMPVSKAIPATVGPASVPPKHEDTQAQRSRPYPKHQAASRPSERARSPRNSQRKHQEKSRRSRSPRRERFEARSPRRFEASEPAAPATPVGHRGRFEVPKPARDPSQRVGGRAG